MSDWLPDAIKYAKSSALPTLVRSFIDDATLSPNVEPEERVDEIVDSIELLLFGITGDVTEDVLRAALEPIARDLANSFDLTWETVADAIIGTLEWGRNQPPSTLDNWRR